MTPTTDAEVLEILQRPFDASVVKQKGRFSYISHGLCTEKLLEADPFYESRVEHVHTYTDGSGMLHCAGVTMTVCVDFPETGVRCRTESGGPQRQESFTNEIKNAQSDAFKRCLMRFGVALGMWESLVDAEGDEDYHPTPKRMPQRDEVNGMPNPPAPVAVNAGLTAEQAAAITRLGAEIDEPAWVNDVLAKQGVSGIDALTRRAASTVIGVMQRRANEVRAEKKRAEGPRASAS